MSEANKELVNDICAAESQLEEKLKEARQQLQQQSGQIADIEREMANQAQISQAKMAHLEQWYSAELHRVEQKLRGYVDAQIASVERPSSTSLDTVNESNDSFTTDELAAIAAALDAADARIVQHQAVTKQLKSETRRGLSELAKVVATL